MNRIVIDSDISYWGFSGRWLSGKLAEMMGDLEVELSSFGGDVFEGIDMFNQLRRYSRDKGHVTVIAGSKVMSIASLILLAGDTRKAHTNSTIMIHKAWTWLAGNADELIAESKILNGIDSILAKQYSKHMNMTHDEIIEVMSNEGWYIGQEQIETTNFINEFITESDEVDLSAKANYRKAMARFSAKAQEDNIKPNFDEVKASIVECNDGKCPTSNNTGSKIVPTASISDDTIKINQGADMAFDRNDLDATEAHYNALMQNKVTMENRNDTLKVELQTVTTALEAKTDEMTKLTAGHEEKLSEAEGNLESFKAETTTRLNEASKNGVSVEVALQMVNAETGADASAIATDALASDGGTRQGNTVEQGGSSILAYAAENKGSIK